MLGHRLLFGFQCFGVAVATLSLPASVAAEPTRFRREVEGWFIHGGHVEGGEGICLMEAEFQGGTKVEVSSRPGRTEFYFTFRNSSWRSIRDRAMMDMTVETDTQTYAVRAMGLNRDGEFGFIFSRRLSDDDLFIGDFALSRGMSIRWNGQRIDGFSLRGTRAGLRALVDCTNAVGNAADYDPFASSPGDNSADPPDNDTRPDRH